MSNLLDEMGKINSIINILQQNDLDSTHVQQ